MAFTGTGKIWMNGKLVDWNDATIHIASHVIHYGAACSKARGATRRRKARRASGSMRTCAGSTTPRKIYRMEPRVDQATLTEAVLETIRANEHQGVLHPPADLPRLRHARRQPAPCPVDVAIMLWEWGAYLGQDALEQGVDVRISSWARMAPNTFPALAKTTANYANSQLIKMEAIADGYSEGIALDTFGYLSEGSGQNLFIVRDDMIYTPPLTASILPGITRDR